jgi:hypothetical protein
MKSPISKRLKVLEIDLSLGRVPKETAGEIIKLLGDIKADSHLREKHSEQLARIKKRAKSVGNYDKNSE